LTYVVEGALRHQDSLGTERSLGVGEVQRMTAGTGIRHSEYNASDDDPVHFLQIWIEPNALGLPPSYEQKSIGTADAAGGWTLVASPDGRRDSLSVHRDVDIWAAAPSAEQRLTHEIGPGRQGWLQVVRGSVVANGHALEKGDGAALDEAGSFILTDAMDAEVLLFDMSDDASR
jgi:quercetin 2,3-dioxygenase